MERQHDNGGYSVAGYAENGRGHSRRHQQRRRLGEYAEIGCACMLRRVHHRRLYDNGFRRGRLERIPYHRRDSFGRRAYSATADVLQGQGRIQGQRKFRNEFQGNVQGTQKQPYDSDCSCNVPFGIWQEYRLVDCGAGVLHYDP